MQVDVSISEMENEVLLSDVTIDELNIEIISFGRGEWRLRGKKIVRKRYTTTNVVMRRNAIINSIIRHILDAT